MDRMNERRRVLIWIGAAALAPLAPTPALGDATGQYHHVGEPGGDPDFQGFGAVAAENGRRRLTSQMFVEGEPGNERDGSYRSLRSDARLVTMRLSSGASGVRGSLDIVVA